MVRVTFESRKSKSGSLDALVPSVSAGMKLHAAKLTVRLGESVEAAAGVLLEESRKECPVDTGALRDTSQVTVYQVGRSSVARVGYGPFGVSVPKFDQKKNRLVVKVPYDYAFWVHEGWGPVAAQPFLANTRVAKMPEMRQAVQAVFHAGVGL